MVSAEEQVRVEGELAEQLSAAPPAERASLYGQVYDRVYEMHLSRNPETLDFGAGPELGKFLRRVTQPGDAVIEIGCGGGFLAIEMAKQGRRVLAVDVSGRILEEARHRAAGASGLTFARTDGTAIPAADSSAEFAYSVEVLEHLHADDLMAHLTEVHRVLKPGGRYWLLTPNRLDGVDSVARFGVASMASRDVHLKEWTYGELSRELRRAGFVALRSPWRNSRLFWMPLLPVSWFAAAERLPSRVVGKRHARSFLGIVACSIVATKVEHERPSAPLA